MSGPVPIDGLFETHLAVADLSRSVAFYHDVIGLSPALEALQDVLGACDRLRALGVTPLSFSATETSEPSVIGWMPAAAIYLRDPDGHLLEYLAMLDAEPRPDAGVLPWSEWIAR